MDEVEQALLPVANIALETGQLETAKRLYQRLLDVDPASQAAHMGLGDVAFKDRRPHDAVRWYLAAQANAQTPEQRNDALLWHGRAALDAGELSAARRSFEHLAAAPEASTISVAWALNGIGLTLLLQGDLRGAVAAMQGAVRRAPGEQMFADNLRRALAMLAELVAREDSAPAATDRAAMMAATTHQDVPRMPSVDDLKPQQVPAGSEPTEMSAPADTPLVAEPQAVEQEPFEPQPDAAISNARPVPLVEPDALEPALPEPEALEPQALEPEAPEPDALQPQALEPEVLQPQTLEPEVLEPEALEREVLQPEVLEPEVLEPEVLEPEEIQPEVLEPEVLEPEVLEQEVLEPEALEPEMLEPEVLQPEALEPEALQPAALQPAALQPEALQPAALQPEALQPEALEPEMLQPEALEPEMLEPEVLEPEVLEPEVLEPEVLQPGELQPEELQPEVLQPEVLEPEMLEPEVLEPEVLELDAEPTEELPTAATLDPAPPDSLADVSWPSIEAGYVVRTDAGVFVQMGAFAEGAPAHTVANLLGDATHEIVRVEGPQDGAADAFYRVRIGPIESMDALAALADRLEAEGFGRPRMSTSSAAAQIFGNLDEDSEDDFEDQLEGNEAIRTLDGFIVQEGAMRFLQLGAFEVRLTANQLANRLRQLTDHVVAVAETSQPDGAQIYRVRVGPIESDRSFVELASVLIANGYDIDQR